MLVRETFALPVHLHVREPLPLPRNVGPALLMRLTALPRSFFRAIPPGIAQRAAGFRHLETRRGCLFSRLLVIRFRLQWFLFSVELHLPLLFTFNPAATDKQAGALAGISAH